MEALTVKDLSDPQTYAIDRLRQMSGQDDYFKWYYLSRVYIEDMNHQGLEKVQAQAAKLDQNDQHQRAFAARILKVIKIRRKCLDITSPEGKIDLAKKKAKEFTKTLKQCCQLPSVWTYCKETFSSLSRNFHNKSEYEQLGEALKVLDEQQNRLLNTAKKSSNKQRRK